MPTDARPLFVYARLLRLPNIFTAVADPLAGWLIVGGGAPAGHLVLLAAASACLYTAGIVFNDCFDYRLDCRERPERPLPRGEVKLVTAWSLAAALMAAGLVCAGLASPVALKTAALIAVLVLVYNMRVKRFALLGPVTLGACRACNLALGLGGFVPLWPPLILGAYVAVMSLVARREEARPELRSLVKRLLLGLIVVDAALVVAGSGDWVGAALVLTLLVPAITLGRIFAMT